jgi:dTDP-4-amino-4,6-dideoxygalactose transaminase
VCLGRAEHWAILKCLVFGRIIDGPDEDKLLEALQRETGARHIFGFGSGQDAIFAALTAHGVGKEDRVILPSYCCETVILPIIRCGAVPVFCDIREDYNVDPDHALSLVQKEVKAIIIPHLFGRAAAIDRVEQGLKRLELRDQILVIDDAAQSFGATLGGRLLGTYGDVGIVSFGAGKTMTATGGGVLLTNSSRLAARIAELPAEAPAGVDKTKALIYWLIFRRWRRFTLPFYALVSRLLQAPATRKPSLQRLANIDAALATTQLQRLPRTLGVRIRRKAMLDSLFGAHPAFASAIPEAENQVSVCTKYVLACASDTRAICEQICDFYQAAGIENLPLYEPLHHRYQSAGILTDLPRTESLWRSALYIPVEPSISDKKWQCLRAGLERILHRADSEDGPAFTATADANS